MDNVARIKKIVDKMFVVMGYHFDDLNALEIRIIWFLYNSGAPTDAEDVKAYFSDADADCELSPALDKLIKRCYIDASLRGYLAPTALAVQRVEEASKEFIDLFGLKEAQNQ